MGKTPPINVLWQCTNLPCTYDDATTAAFTHDIRSSPPIEVSSQPLTGACQGSKITTTSMGQVKSLIRKALCGQEGEGKGSVNGEEQVLEDSDAEGQFGRYRPLHNADGAEAATLRGHVDGDRGRRPRNDPRSTVVVTSASGRPPQRKNRPTTAKTAHYKCCKQHRSVR